MSDGLLVGVCGYITLECFEASLYVSDLGGAMNRLLLLSRWQPTWSYTCTSPIHVYLLSDACHHIGNQRALTLHYSVS